MDQVALRFLCEKFYKENHLVLNKWELVKKFREFGVKKPTAYC